MDAQTAGFDVVYEIDQPSLLAALENLIGDPAVMRLQSLPLAVALPPPAPLNTVQQGSLQTLSPPSLSLELPSPANASGATLSIAFSQTLLALSAVPAIAGIGAFGGVGALAPTAAGTLSIALPLTFSTAANDGATSLAISLSATPTVSQLGSLPALGVLSSAIDLAPLVQNAVAAAVTNALAALFPLVIPIPFDAKNVCGIGAQSLAVKVLPGSGTTKPALGFFLTLLGTSTGNIAAATSSSLTTNPNSAGALLLSNAFLKELICCLFRTSSEVSGLGTASTEDAQCCHWRNVKNVTLGGQRVEIEELDLCVKPGAGGGQSTITLHVLASQSGTGWTAYAQLDLGLQLDLDGNTIGIVQLTPQTKTWTDVSPWVWILDGLAAAVGFVAGLVVGVISGGALLGLAFEGGVIGAALGLALVGVVYLVLDGIGSIAAAALSGVTGLLGEGQTALLPPALTSNFGSINDLVAVDFDDLYVGGNMLPPMRANAYSQGTNLVLGFGDSIDLDRGIVQRSGQSVPGFALEGDLQWQEKPMVFAPAAAAPGDGGEKRLSLATIGGALSGITPVRGGTIVSLTTSRLAPLGSASFWSLTESTLASVAFPAARAQIDGGTIVSSAVPWPVGATVFAVRTTDQRLAKCVAWRDAENALHLSYVTYNSPVPLAIASTWSVTTGAAVSSGPIWNTYQVARTGRFSATTRGIPSFPQFPFPIPGVTQPLPYTWLWNGSAIAGSGKLSDGTTTYAVGNGTIALQTAMGTTLQGVLQLELPLYGTTFVATVDLDEPGTERTIDVTQTAFVPVGPTTGGGTIAPIRQPIADQLAGAFARGMNVSAERAVFK